MALEAKTPEQIAAMTPADRVAFIQEARNFIAQPGNVLDDDIHATVIAVLRFERRMNVEAIPAGRKKAATNKAAAAPALTIDDL